MNEEQYKEEPIFSLAFIIILIVASFFYINIFLGLKSIVTYTPNERKAQNEANK